MTSCLCRLYSLKVEIMNFSSLLSASKGFDAVGWRQEGYIHELCYSHPKMFSFATSSQKSRGSPLIPVCVEMAFTRACVFCTMTDVEDGKSTKTSEHVESRGFLHDVDARIRDLEEKISRTKEREDQLNQQLGNGRDALRNLKDQIEKSKQNKEHLQEQLNSHTQCKEELLARLDRIQSKENKIQEQAQKKSDKVKQIKTESEELKEATSGLKAHLQKQVHRQEDIARELEDISDEVDQESEKRKSKEVLGRLKDLAERENTLQVELKAVVRYLKVEIPRQIEENCQEEEKLKNKLLKVEEKESSLKESLRAKSNKRKLVESDITTCCETEALLKEKLELETGTENRLNAQLEELETAIEQNEQELRHSRNHLAELMSELDKAKIDEAQARDLSEKETKEARSLETEQGQVSVRDTTLESLVDDLPPSRSIDRHSNLPAV